MKRIESFQGLRAVAFIAIFISHTPGTPHGGWGAWAVSVFFCLSGFLMIYNYLLRDDEPKFGFKFMWNKIRKLYVLHIVLTFIRVLIEIPSIVSASDALHLLFTTLLHALLLQIWIPNPTYYSSLNAVSWYLCVCAFTYLCFPLILKFFKKIKKKNCTPKTNFIIGILGVATTSLAICGISYFSLKNGNWYPDDIISMKWITYFCPLTRLLDFILGCFLGYSFIQYSHTPSLLPSFLPSFLPFKASDLRRNSTRPMYVLAEILVLLLISCSLYIYRKTVWIFSSDFVKYTLLFVPTTPILIWLIACGKGIISRLLNNKLLCKIGYYSQYAFLIHPVILNNSITNGFCKKIAVPGSFIVAIISFALTIEISILWDYFYNRFQKREIKK